MKAEIRRNPASFQASVWLYDETSQGRAVLRDIEGNEVERIINGAIIPEPTFICPIDVIEALVAAGSDLLPPDRAQGKHLDDAIGVRDRLLTLIERGNG